MVSLHTTRQLFPTLIRQWTTVEIVSVLGKLCQREVKRFQFTFIKNCSESKSLNCDKTELVCEQPLIACCTKLLFCSTAKIKSFLFAFYQFCLCFVKVKYNSKISWLKNAKVIKCRRISSCRNIFPSLVKQSYKGKKSFILIS